MSKEATVERRHRELAWLLVAESSQGRIQPGSHADTWLNTGGSPGGWDFSEEEAAAEKVLEFELQLDTPRLQSDMQRIRERLATEKAWDEGYAAGGADEGFRRNASECARNPYRKDQGGE